MKRSNIQNIGQYITSSRPFLPLFCSSTYNLHFRLLVKALAVFGIGKMLIRFQISGCLVGRQTSSCCCLWKQNTLSRSSIRANRLTVPSRPFLGSTMPHRRGPVEQESLTCRLWPFDLAWGTGSIDSQVCNLRLSSEFLCSSLQ